MATSTSTKFEIPRDLHDTTLDGPAIILILLFNFTAIFVGLSLYAAEEINLLITLILVLILGWGPLFYVANRLTRLNATFLMREEDSWVTAIWVMVGLVGMVILSVLASIADRSAYVATLPIAAATGTVLWFLVTMSAVNEEFALANLQRALTGGLQSELVVAVGILARGVIFWGLHQPIAYSKAPFAIQLTLFLNGCLLGLVFATTKRYSVPILAHLIWNILAIM